MAALSGEATESCGFKMAGAEGGPGDGELWQTWLPNHAVFLRLREGLKNQSSTETEKPASSLPSSPPLPPQLLTRNLVLGLGGELFLWDPEESSFLVVRLRGPSGAGEEPSLSQYQVRLGRIGKRPLASVFVPFASWLFLVCWWEEWYASVSRRLFGGAQQRVEKSPFHSLYHGRRTFGSLSSRISFLPQMFIDFDIAPDTLTGTYALKVLELSASERKGRRVESQ